MVLPRVALVLRKSHGGESPVSAKKVRERMGKNSGIKAMSLAAAQGALPLTGTKPAQPARTVRRTGPNHVSTMLLQWARNDSLRDTTPAPG